MGNRVRTGSIFVLLAVIIAALAAATLSLLPNAHRPNVTATSNVGEIPDAYEPVSERVFAHPEGIQEESDLPPIDKEPPDYPNLDSNLNRLAETAAAVRRSASADGNGSGETAEPVLVTFYIEPDHVADVHQYLLDNGVFVRHAGEDYIEAHVPPGLLGAASERPGVLRVDTVIPPQQTQTRENLISQGVGLHGAEAWHDAGYRGNRVRVGVIDGGFEGFSSLQGSELPSAVTARCYFSEPRAPSSRLQDCEVDSDHGTIVAETLIDVAPAVDLYIANPQTLGDLRDAADWMAERGVGIINHSIGHPPLGPGDGTSPLSVSSLRTIDVAVEANIAWINAGGNSGMKVWHGTYTEPDDTGFHHFTPDDIGNTFYIKKGDQVLVFMRWEGAWGGADCDLDLELYRSVRGPDGKYPLVLYDHSIQDGSEGSVPFAFVGILDGEATASDAGYHFLAIRKHTCAEEPAWIQLIAWVGSPLQHRTPAFHMGHPEESRKRGMLAVGATHYWNTKVIAPYSSRGPTLDGRIKPDITGVACGRSTALPVITLEDGTQCWFPGTSQASPHVAGLAALAKQAFPGYTPVQLTSYLRRNAAERGAAGADNIWGHGLATLPDPSTADFPLRPLTNVMATSNGAGELTLTWEGGENADFFLLLAVNMTNAAQGGPYPYDRSRVNDPKSRTGNVTALRPGAPYLGIVVAVKVTGMDIQTLHRTAGIVTVQ